MLMSTTGGRLKHVGAGEVWSVTDAAELYEVPRWGKGYFSVSSAGSVQVHPTKDPSRAIDLKQLADDLQARGINLPLLIRFSDILRHRLSDIHDAFKAAISQHQYGGRYCCVYPIKVNQQRQVVEEVLDFGAPYRFGLEAGSKPELLAVIAMASNDTPIICNGFKDAEYIETVMLASKMGRTIIPVVEKYTELELILEYCEKVGVRPQIGMRVKLAARGGGRWSGSGGYRSKFGLTVGEILTGLEALKQRGMQDCFKLLHFHLGSQIPNIRVVKHALNEAARIYTELHKAGAGLEYLDVGGGLGVDYDGSQTNFESSTNYTLEEYANDVVYHIQSVCDDAGVPHPTIVMSGASPDGLLGTDGVLELKCPNTATHIETLLGQAVPGKYVWQIQWQLACTGRKWADFVSYDPRMSEEMRLFVRRINRDDEMIEEATKQVLVFLSEIDEKVATLKRLYRPQEAEAA